MDQRTAWQQRIHAVLYHHGLPERSWLLAEQGRAWLARLELGSRCRTFRGCRWLPGSPWASGPCVSCR
jgi:hypothetical protein